MPAGFFFLYNKNTVEWGLVVSEICSLFLLLVHCGVSHAEQARMHSRHLWVVNVFTEITHIALRATRVSKVRLQ